MDEPQADGADLDGMLDFGGDAPDHKRVTFRIMGADLDPDKITHATGLRPDLAHRKGEPTGKRRGPTHWREGQWSLESAPPLPRGGNHLEDHIRLLLDRLDPHVAVLRAICRKDDLRMDFYCGYFMGQANSGFALSPETLAGIAALGADLGVDIYSENVETELKHWLANAESGP